MGKQDNPTRGTTTIEIDGKTYTMRLTWHGVAQIRRLYPDGYNLADPEHLSVILSIAMAKHHPEMTPEEIMDLSPPLETSIQAATEMVNYSWWGDAKPKEDTENTGENPRGQTSMETAA